MDFEQLKNDMKQKYLRENPVIATRDLDSMDLQYKSQQRELSKIEFICDIIKEYDKRKQEG